MALRAVPDHPKFAHLKALLKLPKGPALGYLECIWHFAGRFTPQGNIGKYDDLAIETWVEWDGQPGVLVQALVTAKWLDVDAKERLLVHDWPQHADKATKQALNRAHLAFCVPTVHTPGEQNSDLSSLPVPVPVPVPVPEPEREEKTALAPAVPPESDNVRSAVQGAAKLGLVNKPDPIPSPYPEGLEKRIKAIADAAPDPQDYWSGVQLLTERIKNAVDAPRELSVMEENIPLWFAAMLDGRAKMKTLRYLLIDRDYLRKPREPTASREQQKPASKEISHKPLVDKFAHLEKAHHEKTAT